MMDLAIIAALDEANGIGYKGDLPWSRLEGELPRFKKLTIPHPVIMGRNTYESILKRRNGFPLPQRYSIVIASKSKLPENLPPSVIRTHSFEQARDVALAIDDEVYVIGGTRVFEAALPYANRLELTHVRGTHPADTFFPKINYDEWHLTAEEPHETHCFKSYLRKR